LAEATFQQFIAIFESFLFDLLRVWLTAYPQNLFGRKLDVRVVVEASDKDSVLRVAVEKEVNDVLYDRPAEWFQYTKKLVNISVPTAAEIDRIAEAKTTRDVLIHNRGIVGRVYLDKAGTLARYAVGQRLDIPSDYHRNTWELLCKIVTDVADAAAAKVP
jgi:hypothetical protein